MRLALARTMHYVCARHVQDQRRIRALRDVRARLHSWPASERMQLNYRDPGVNELFRCPGILLRIGFHGMGARVRSLGHFCVGNARDKQVCAVSAGWYCPS